MPKINQNVSNEVVVYRRWVSFLRNCDKQDLDAEVWAEYMERHPIEDQPNYEAMKAFSEAWKETGIDQLPTSPDLTETDHDRKETQ